MNGPPTDAAHRLASPGRAIALVGAGHAAWGLVAYRKPLVEILRAGAYDTVGDGIFRRAHSDDARAAGFWFMFAAPLMGLCGHLLEVALRSADREAVLAGGRTVLGLGAVGTAVMPRSGFPAVLPIGLWAIRRGRQMPRSTREAETHAAAAPQPALARERPASRRLGLRPRRA